MSLLKPPEWLISLDDAADRSRHTRETVRCYLYRYGFIRDVDFVVHSRLVGRRLRRTVYLTNTGLTRLITQDYGKLAGRVDGFAPRRTQERALWGPAQRRPSRHQGEPPESS